MHSEVAGNYFIELEKKERFTPTEFKGYSQEWSRKRSKQRERWRGEFEEETTNIIYYEEEEEKKDIRECTRKCGYEEEDQYERNNIKTESEGSEEDDHQVIQVENVLRTS